MCTWSGNSVTEYFNKRGAPVYSAAMDMSEAFDMVSWQELFLTLKGRMANPLVLRVLLNIYKSQQWNVP